MEGIYQKKENNITTFKDKVLLHDFYNSCLLVTNTNQEVWTKIKELLEKTNRN